MSLKKKFTLFLEAIDVLAFPISSVFSLKRKLFYSNFLTKFASITIFSLCFASCFYFSQNIYSNPKIEYNEEYKDPQEGFTMDSDRFFIIFAMENMKDKFSPFIDETIYEANATLILFKHADFVKKTPLELEQCNENNFPKNPDLRKNFQSLDYSKMYCFKNYSNAQLLGSWNSFGFHQDLSINLSICNNKTRNNTCKSLEFIQERIKYSYIRIYYAISTTSLDDYDSPLRTNIIYDYYELGMNDSKRINLYFGFTKIETKGGLFGFFGEDQVKTGIYYLKSSSNPYDFQTKTFGEISFFLDNLRKINKRNYENILDVLSKIGGLLRILTLISSIFLKPFLRNSLFQKVTNENINYEMEDEKGAVYDSSVIKISFWESLKSIFMRKECLDKNTRKLIEKIEKTKNQFDIAFFLKKIMEVDKTKFSIEKIEKWHKYKKKLKTEIINNGPLNEKMKLIQNNQTFKKKYSDSTDNKNINTLNKTPIQVEIELGKGKLFPKILEKKNEDFDNVFIEEENKEEIQIRILNNKKINSNYK